MKINRILIISMLVLAIFAIGAVSASENVSEVQSIEDDTVDLSAQTADDKMAAVNEDDEAVAVDEQETPLSDGDAPATTTKNITVYSEGKLVDTFNFTTAGGNNFTFKDVIGMLNKTGGDMSNVMDFAKMFGDFNFTEGLNKTVDFTVSGGIGKIKYDLRVVSTNSTYIFDYKIVSSQTGGQAPLISKTLSFYSDGNFLSNVTLASNGFDLSELIKQFESADFDMSSMGKYIDNFKNMSAFESNGTASNRSFYFKIDDTIGSIKFEMLVISNATDFVFDYNIIYPRVATVLVANDLTTSAVNVAVDGNSGKYLTVTLKDSFGIPIPNKELQIGFNGAMTKVKTDILGTAKLQVNVAKAGTYTASICFLGDATSDSSFKVVKVKVNKQTAKLTTAKKTYKAKAKTKKLTATFKSADGKAIKGKKIAFNVKGKTYSAKTNAKGVATVKVKLTKKGKYTFTAKFAGDDTYKAASKKAKLILK